MIKLLSATAASSHEKLYAWVQHVRLSTYKADKWVDNYVAEAMFHDAPTYTTSDLKEQVDVGKLKRTATVVTIIKIYEGQGDFKAGIAPLSTGVSICDVQDQWARKYGRDQALKRALNRMKLEFIKDDHRFVDHN